MSWIGTMIPYTWYPCGCCKDKDDCPCSECPTVNWLWWYRTQIMNEYLLKLKLQEVVQQQAAYLELQKQQRKRNRFRA